MVVYDFGVACARSLLNRIHKLLVRGSAPTATRKTSRHPWFDGFDATASSAADAAETGSEDALTATAKGVAGLEATLATARARLADARRELPCQAPLDAESLGLLVQGTQQVERVQSDGYELDV